MTHMESENAPPDTEVSAAPFAVLPLTQAPHWPRLPMVILVTFVLLFGSVSVAFALLPSVRLFVLTHTPFYEEQILLPQEEVIVEVPAHLEPSESISPPPIKESPQSTTVKPTVTQPVKSTGSVLPPADTTAPVLSLSAPANGSTVSGKTVVLSVTASDKVGVVSVQFSVDGSSVGPLDTAAPYSTIWDTTSVANGKHTVSATARDAAGNVGIAANISITVNNVTSAASPPAAPLPPPPPPVSTAPPPPALPPPPTSPVPSPDTTAPSIPIGLAVSVISSAQLNLSWSAATDAVGVTGYKLERCTGSSCTNYAEIATPSGTTHNNTGLAAATTYRYRVRATDAAGNLSGYSTAVSGATEAAAPTTITISMLNNSYSPTNITIANGTTVIFKNDSTKNRWPASDPHPTHTDYPVFDSLQAVPLGASWSFTFQQAGLWYYHDHLQPGVAGLITVQ